MRKNILTPYFILAAFILFTIAHHGYAFFGHYGFDDLHYARLANAFLQGEVDYKDHYSYRFAILIPTALAYALFGVNDFASALSPLLCTFLILYLVFVALRQHSNFTLAIGLGLSACSNWLLYYSDKLMPDIYVALAVMLSVFIVDRYKYQSDQSQPQRYALGLVTALGFGWLAKETIVLTLPMLLVWMLVDVIQRRHLKFWGYTIIYGVLFLGAYFTLIWALTGNFLERLDAIASNSYLNACSYDQQSTQVLLKRLYYDFFALTSKEGILFSFVFIGAYLFRKEGLRLFRQADSLSFYASSALLLFLASNFMSISLKAYVPMCLDPRHYLFLIPVAAVPAARIIGEFVEGKKYGLQILVGLTLAALFLYSINGQLFDKPYLPGLIVVAGFYYLPSKAPVFKLLFTLLFLSVLLIGPIQQMQYARKVQYPAQRAITYQQFIDKNEPCYIITDPVQQRLGAYYSGFSPNRKDQFLRFEQVDFDSLDGRKQYLYLNWHTQYLSGLNNADLPDYVRNLDTLTNPAIYQNKALNLAIYELKVKPKAYQVGATLLQSLNDFAGSMAYWEQSAGSVEHRGKRAYRFNEFSATFNYPLDSLDKTQAAGIRIVAKALLNVPSATQSKLVISIENPEGAYFWQALDVVKFIKVYDNWWPVNYEVELAKTALKPNSRLKVYLWNEDKKEGWVDDFEVRVMELH